MMRSTTKWRVVRRRLALGVGLTLLAMIVCGGMALGVSLYYPRLGRITDFQFLTPGLRISGTNYVSENNDDEVLLRNTITQKSINLGKLGVPNLPAYKVLNYQNRLYLIIMNNSSGSFDGWDFTVYNITTDQPDDLNLDDTN